MPVNRTHEIHCEKCGASATANASGIWYCLECSLYVCARCWDLARDRCHDCVRSTAGTSRRGASIRTTRRADRRLRETVWHANDIALAGDTNPDLDARIEHACLTIKSATAARAGSRALGRLRGQQAETARSLAARLRRHAHEADAALVRAASALADGPLPTEALRHVTLAPGGPGTGARRFLGRGYAEAAAVLVVGVVAGAMVTMLAGLPNLVGTQPAREGTLAGNDPVVPSSVASAAPAPGDGDAAASSPAEATLSLDFDAGRMGEGLGSGWVQTFGGPDAVAVAPFPTAVNRSARLESIDGAGAEACRAIASRTVQLTRLTVDVFLAEPDTTAVVIARDASGAAKLQMSLGTSDSTFSISPDAVASAGGLPAGQWLRAEIAAQDGQTLWRVDHSSLDGVIDETIDGEGLLVIHEVCLAAANDSTGPAHFDNLAVVILEEG